MSNNLSVKKSILLNADISEVWEALTNPKITKRYFFGCETISDWAVGSPIEFKMHVEGQDIIAVMGMIIAIEPQRTLEYSCFIPEDENDPSKHTKVNITLSSDINGTRLSVTQGDFQEDRQRFIHTEKNWEQVLNDLKAIIENEKNVF